MKALMIYLYHYAGIVTAKKEAVNNGKDFLTKDIADAKNTKYSETILNNNNIAEGKNPGKYSWELTFEGEMVFQYEGGFKFKPVSSRLEGAIEVSFTYNGQYVIWVIPVTLEITVTASGQIEISLKFDEDRPVDIEELKATIEMKIEAKLGVGCTGVSIGIYGNVGTVIVVDIIPDFGIESWKVTENSEHT